MPEKKFREITPEIIDELIVKINKGDMSGVAIVRFVSGVYHVNWKHPKTIEYFRNIKNNLRAIGERLTAAGYGKSAKEEAKKGVETGGHVKYFLDKAKPCRNERPCGFPTDWTSCHLTVRDCYLAHTCDIARKIETSNDKKGYDHDKLYERM